MNLTVQSAHKQIICTMGSINSTRFSTYRRFISADGFQYHLQFVAPRQLHPEILEELHSGAVAGHLGEEKTLSRLKQRFYWPGHWNDVRRWCQNLLSVCC